MTLAAFLLLAQVVDLSSSVSCNEERCALSPVIDEAFRRMLIEDAAGFRGEPINIAGKTYIARFAARHAVGVDASVGATQVTSTVSFGEDVVRWHGLRVTGLERVQGWEFDSTALIFAEPAPLVRATLQRLGVPTPVPPAYREIETEECSASVGLETRGTNTAFVHSRWC